MRRLDALRAAIAILFLAAATLAGAFVFQALGHAPCELCLKERIPYYIGIVVALFAILLAVRGPRRLLPATFAALFLIFAASAAFGAYHAGIEWGFWAGPSSCTGTIAKASSMQEFLHRAEYDQGGALRRRGHSDPGPIARRLERGDLGGAGGDRGVGDYTGEVKRHPLPEARERMALRFIPGAGEGLACLKKDL